MRHTIRNGLERLRLLPLVVALIHVVPALRPSTLRYNLRFRRAGPDGFPMPPLRLIHLVLGSYDRRAFFETGRDHAEDLQRALQQSGATLEGTAVLDFGCGCGRVIRHWRHLADVKMTGTDYNPRLLEWCVENLNFADFDVNCLAPPLPYDDDSFELVYALSVFTHLPAELQRAWRDELTRVLRPGGHLVITTHGEAMSARLSASHRQRFSQGNLVVLHPRLAGLNACAAYHPESYLRGAFAGPLEVAGFFPDRLRWGHHDVTVFRVPALSPAPS